MERIYIYVHVRITYGIKSEKAFTLNRPMFCDWVDYSGQLQTFASHIQICLW